MTSGKKDFTRIEDLGEFFHENVEDEIPDLPVAKEETSFESHEWKDSDHALENNLETEDSSFDFESTKNVFFVEENSSAEETEPVEFSHPIEETVFSYDPSQTDVSTQTDSPATESVESFETFSELTHFTENSNFSGMATEGNPSFSVLIKDVHYVEDVGDILILLKELELLADSEDKVRARLMRGVLLIPRISEFAAILLAHKLRRFDVDIHLGPSDEIHPPKHKEPPETGVVSKHNLYQNQGHHFQFDEDKVDIKNIIISATPSLDGHQVMRYLGIASEHKIIDGNLIEDENSSEVISLYQELAHKLKAHAVKVNSNAVVGLNYQLTPIPSEYGISANRYRLTCTGNLVWVNKL
jgi:hypothetical protein